MSETTEYKGIPKLMAVTYSAWKWAMTMTLMSERCIYIVENNEGEPEPPIQLLKKADATTIHEYNRSFEKYQMR